MTQLGTSSPLPALCLHGFMGVGADWSPAVDSLADLIQPLAPDLPGHGRDPRRPVGGLTTLLEELIQLADAAGWHRFGLIGYSMGARIALHLALRLGGRCAWAVLESGSPGLATEVERSARRLADRELAEKLGGLADPAAFDKFLRRWYSAPLFGEVTEHQDFKALVQRRAAGFPAALAASLIRFGTGELPSLWPALPTLTAPLLLLVGERDTKFRRIGAAMQSLCRDATLGIVPGCAHATHFEKPAEFAKQVRAFLSLRLPRTKEHI